MSRKFTQFPSISEQTALKYINEIGEKYPRGATIADVPSNVKNDLIGKKLDGQYILEVPVQKYAVPRSVINAADKAGVLIRDINGKVY